jgi:predicted permease
LAPGISSSRAAAAALPSMLYEDERYFSEWNRLQQQPLNAVQLHNSFLEYWVTLRRMTNGTSRLRDQFSEGLHLLMNAVLLLLALVCANISGLLLAEYQERRKDFAVRLSLGASRLALARQTLLENLLTGVFGSALGVGFAFLLGPPLLGLLPAARGLDQFATPRILSVTPDLRVVVFAVTVCCACVFLFGVAPTPIGTRFDLNSELNESARSHTSHITGIVPVAIQAALSVVLLSAACLMLRTFWILNHLNPGFDRGHILAFTVDPAHAGYSAEQSAVFLRELLERIAALPGVRSASYSCRGLMRGAGLMKTVSRPRVTNPTSAFVRTSVDNVSPTFFRTMGIALLGGRQLEEVDAREQIHPVIINRALANLLFPSENPLGKLVVDGPDNTKRARWVVVGLVGTAKYRSLREPDPPTMYTLFNESFNEPAVLYVRTFGDPVPTIGTVRKTIEALDASVPIIEAKTMEQDIYDSLWQERLVTILTAFFGVTAALLAAVGLYGSLAYSIARRNRELGIRIAVGAQTHHVIATVCTRLGWSVLSGIVGGLLASFLLLRLMQHFLFGVSTLDAASLALATGTVVLFGTLAATPPIRSALTTDPAKALRGA